MRFALVVLLLAIAIFAGVVHAGAVDGATRWFWQNPLPVGNDLNDIAFQPDGLVGWTAGDKGALLRTTTAGALWVEVENPMSSTDDAFSIAAPAPNEVWVASSRGLLHSSDSGSSWSVAGAVGTPRSIRFADAMTGWYGNENGGIFRTVDGGSTWTPTVTPYKPVSSDDPRAVREILAEGDSLIAVVGADIWCSTDGGAGWTVARDATIGQPRVAFSSPMVGVAIVGWDFVRTTDGGRTWSTLYDVISHSEPNVPAEIRLNEVWFASATLGYAHTNMGWVYRTLDAGKTWARFTPAFLDRYGEIAASLPVLNASARVGSRWLFCGESGAVAFTGDLGASYQNLTSDFNENLRGASFVTTMTGLGVGEGEMLYTDDGGAVWTRLATGLTFVGDDVSLANGSGWAVGCDSIYAIPEIIRVTRSGASYTVAQQTMPTGAGTTGGKLTGVWTNDGISGWAVGDMGEYDGVDNVFKTTNSGGTWRRIPVPAAPRDSLGQRAGLRAVQVYPTGAGWLVGAGLMRTQDAGETWVNLTGGLPAGFEFFDAWGVDGGTCVAAGKSEGIPAVTITSDRGATWVTRTFASPLDGAYVTDVYFADAEHGWVLLTTDWDAKVVSTTDGGRSWLVSRGLGFPARTLAGASDSVWVIGDGGRVLFNGGALGDFTPPKVRTNAPTGWSLGDATVYLTGVDQCGITDLQWRFDNSTSSSAPGFRAATSGIGFQAYSGPIRVTQEGVVGIQSYARDLNGNTGAPSTVSVRVDKSAPTTLSQLRDVHSMSPALELSASDSASGVRATYYALDAVGGRYGAPVALPRLGWHRVEYWSTDYAGRTEAHRAIEFAQDGRAAHLAVAGLDRFGTAVQMSQRTFPAGARAVVIATGRNWPDALGGAALAGAVEGPILLVDTNSVPSVVLDEIRRLGVERIFILGGTSAVTASVEATLKREAGGAVYRLGGASRYETADLIAAKVVEEQGASWDGTFMVATGADFPDALAASPVIAAKRWPLVLAPRTGVVASTSALLGRLGGSRAVLLGGVGALPPAVEAQIRALPTVESAVRLSGANRYETAAAVASFGVSDAGLGWNGVAISTGYNFPDALAGGVAQGKSGSVLLLTRRELLESAPRAALVANREAITEVVYLGGQAAVSQQVRSAVGAVLR